MRGGSRPEEDSVGIPRSLILDCMKRSGIIAGRSSETPKEKDGALSVNLLVHSLPLELSENRFGASKTESLL